MPTLIFDGDCGFCTDVARHFERHSRTPLTIVPWQIADLARFGLTQAQTSERVYLSTEEGNFSGAECFAELMKIQGDAFHRMVARIMRLPGVSRLAEWGYTLIARNRNRLPGGTPACARPPVPDVKEN
jgi:predicted DCC family thiol-disulfide oxidoreductase YuxK